MQSSNCATSIADGLLHEVDFRIWFVPLLFKLLILCSASLPSTERLPSLYVLECATLMVHHILCRKPDARPQCSCVGDAIGIPASLASSDSFVTGNKNSTATTGWGTICSSSCIHTINSIPPRIREACDRQTGRKAVPRPGQRHHRKSICLCRNLTC